MASHALYAGVLGAIVLTLLTVSLSRLHKTRTKADYLVAGRSLPAFVLVTTLALVVDRCGVAVSRERRMPTAMDLPRCGRGPADGPGCC